jgi:hypothetical protein
MPPAQQEQEIAMLRAEMEMLVQERSRLLKVAGAAAVFIANMDIKKLPKHVFDAADVLATSVNGLPEDTLRDALESVGAKVAVDTDDRRQKPRE